jgi:hypothetical protein
LYFSPDLLACLDARKPQIELSAKALSDLKLIMEEEYCHEVEDAEVSETGLRLLKFFSRLIDEPHNLEPEPEPKPKLGIYDPEFEALKYLHHCVYHNKGKPTVRGIAQAAGFSSSRSGQRILNLLIEKGLAYRNDDGSIELSGHVAGVIRLFRLKTHGLSVRGKAFHLLFLFVRDRLSASPKKSRMQLSHGHDDLFSKKVYTSAINFWYCRPSCRFNVRESCAPPSKTKIHPCRTAAQCSGFSYLNPLLFTSVEAQNCRRR